MHTFATVTWNQQPVQIELQWLRAHDTQAPLLVFLHEGLGSVALWRDFPDRLCEALRCRGLVYSRPGYGQSTPRSTSEHWAPDFLERQAIELLPALLQAVGVDAKTQPIHLLGHSDGASIALLYAARFPEQVTRTVVIAPHIFVEDVSITSIEKAREAYLHDGLKERLARYHLDADSAFWGWNDVWLSPAFRRWDIRHELASIQSSVFALQGLKDEYGTLEQIHGIAKVLPTTELLTLPQCGHSPHRDQPDQVIAACQTFFQQGDKP